MSAMGQSQTSEKAWDSTTLVGRSGTSPLLPSPDNRAVLPDDRAVPHEGVARAQIGARTDVCGLDRLPLRSRLPRRKHLGEREVRRHLRVEITAEQSF